MVIKVEYSGEVERGGEGWEVQQPCLGIHTKNRLVFQVWVLKFSRYAVTCKKVRYFR